MTIIRRRMQTVIHRYAAANLQPVGARQVRGIAATDALSPVDGYSLVIGGGDLSRLQQGALSWNHVDPIGTVVDVSKAAHEILFTGDFGPQGVDEEIDALCRKCKAGLIKGVSLSFRIIKDEPINPGRPDLGMRATQWEALEIALCLVGVDPGAKITERARRRRAASEPGVTAMQANLPHLDQALDEHRAFGRHQSAIADATQRLDEHRSRFGTSLRGLHAAIAAGDPEAAAEHHGRCMRCMRGMQREMKAIGDSHQDGGDALLAIGRCMRSAGNILGLDASGAPIGDDDADDYNTNAGYPVDDGDADDQQLGRSTDYRRRQLDKRRLAAADPRRAEAEALRLVGQSYRTP
jgi:hypothetical protein